MLYMLYYVYVIVIYDGMYVRNMVNILQTIMKVWLTLFQQVVRLFGDGNKGLMEENGTYGAAGVLWDFSWRSVDVFSGGGDTGMPDDGDGDRLWL